MTKSPSGGAPLRRATKCRNRRLTRKSVFKMLVVMAEEGEGGHNTVKDFLTSGRVGRRNALPDILSDHSMTTTSDLPDKMKNLTTKDPSEGTSEKSLTTDGKDAQPGRSSDGS